MAVKKRSPRTPRKRKAAAGRPAAEAPADPTALTPDELAAVLQCASERIAGDLAAGAPADRHGRVNLAHYVAWVIWRQAGGGQTHA